MEFDSNAFPERLLIKTYDEDGNILTEWDEEKGWFEDGTEFTEYGEQIMNRIYHPYTDSQLSEIQLKKEEAALAESRRNLTLDEVVDLFVRSQVNAVNIPDQTSLRMMEYYPEFSEIVGQTVKMGFKFRYEGVLYKTFQSDLLIQEHYPPGVGTESLYARIDLEHTGAIYDPIPYDGNMELFAGKYYIQSNTVYFCNRDTGAPVYHTLADLVGLYVEVIERG